MDHDTDKITRGERIAEKNTERRKQVYEEARVAQMKMLTVANRIHMMERAVTPALFSGDHAPDLLRRLYKARVELAKEYKVIQERFEKEFRVPGPGDWTFDPPELLDRIKQVREKFTLPDWRNLRMPSASTTGCPGEIVKLSSTLQKLDFPNEAFEHDGHTSGRFTFDPFESNAVGIVRGVSAIDDGGAFYDDPLGIGNSTRLATSTLLEFSLFKDWEASCAYDTIRWEVEIEAELSVNSDADSFFCLTDAGVNIDLSGTAPRPSHFMELELHPLLEINSRSRDRVMTTVRRIAGSFRPTSPTTKLYLGFATFNMALNGGMSTSEAFKIRPTLGSFDFWGVSYIVFNA